ncbi:MAG: efflux RND transporter periplasmic adaptor subunit, partial [Pseudomonadota bacterium]
MRHMSKILVAVAILAALGWWYWNVSHPDPVSVTVAYVERGDVEERVANTRAGTIKACRRAKMSPSLGGQINTLPFAEGARVKQGDVLLQLWNEDLQAEIELTASNLQAVSNRFHASCVQAGVTQRTADRFKELERSGSISNEEYDQAKSKAEVSAADCEASRADLAVAMAKKRVAEARLERTILRAPFDGIIAEISGELNEYVTPSPPGIQTPPAIDLIEPECFIVSAPIDEVDAPRIQSGMPARITLDAWRGRLFEGSVLRIGAYVIDVEKQARTVEVELQLTNREDLDALLVGYSADVDIILDTRQDVLRIPSEALTDDSHVLVLDVTTGMLESRAIERGLHNWSYSEILSGLEAGEAVVTSVGDKGVQHGAVA